VSAAKAVALIGVGGTIIWIIYRKATNQPLNPFDKNSIGAVQATPTGQNAAEASAENARAEPYQHLGKTATVGQALQTALDKYRNLRKSEAADEGKGGIIEEVKKNALPAAVATGAAIGAVGLQKLLAQKGITPKIIPLAKTPAGLVKPASTIKSPTTLAKPVPAKVGTMPLDLRRTTTVQVPKPQPIVKAAAMTGKTASAAAIDSTKALAGLKAAGRVAGRAVLPIAVGLSVYDAAERIQRKGYENFDIGDAVASASGLGGLGLRQYLPDWLKNLAGVKVVEVPQVAAAAAAQSAAQRKAAMAAVRSRYQTRYRSGG
jgi:hypothetical protein